MIRSPHFPWLNQHISLMEFALMRGLRRKQTVNGDKRPEAGIARYREWHNEAAQVGK
jgi:hypothetical protein